MGLSYDIISEFVKVTNGNKEKPKEGIVYATIVQASDGKYVKIDGSDLLTPTDTTTDIEDGERVTVMIKDHRATVTGNVTAPSASGNRVDKVVETVTEQIGVFETVVADKVSTNELEAYKATIEHLIAGKAEIEDLEATNAEIENLKVKNAEIENAVIDKATIEDLEAVNAVIENLKVKDAEIENLVADKATINDLNAVNADIQNLKAQHAHIEDLVADKADIEDLEATNAVIENLKAKDAEIENLVANKATIEDLEATKAEIEVLDADFAEIKTLVSGNLTSDNILSFNITADKVTMEDAFIKDAMIDTVNAAKINAGRINTNSVVIGSEDGGMRISGATQQFTDKNGNVRIQIGRDASNDFTFALYGEDGQGQIINQNGITASAIADGLIVNDMVSDNAAISGGKLDISSVVTEINNDNTTTIKSNKIYLDEQNQSLEVAFKSLKTQVDTIKDIDSDLTTITDKIQSNTSKIEANKSSISTLLAEDAAIKKQVTDLEGNVVETTNTLTSKYTSLQQNLDGFKTTVNNTYATKTSVNDVKNNLSSNYSTTSAMNSAINQKVDEISASISSTYATKNEVKTIDDNIKANYSTTEQMSSAISVAKDEINLGISKVYETKTEVSNKIGDAISKVQIGGRNYLLNTAESVTVTGNNGTNQTNYFYSLVNKDPRPFRNKKITFSADYELSSDAVGTFKFQTNGKSNDSLGIASGYWTELSSSISISSSSNRIGQIVYTRTMSDSDAKGYTGIGLRLDNFTGTITIKNAKFEIGDKNTSWTPAVEDIDADISSAITTSNEYTDSQIKISKDAIELGVSQTYETKSSVSSQISSTLTSAKSYADTKKSEAISTASSDATTKANNALTSAKSYADTKKTEAINSANSTLNTTIANYYTKTQTDSQIKVAKDAINLGVSQTYETKTNVTSKVNSAISTASSDATSKANNALNSAKSYADTKKSEAITSANNTLNNTIANYYTKAQTDSQINIAKDAIDLSVKNTYETKSNVQTQINNIQVGGTNLVRNSDFSNGTNNWSSVSPWEIHPTTTYNGKKVCYISRSGLTSDSWAELKSNNVSCKQGESYTMSVDIKTSGLVASTDTATLYIWSYDSNGGNRQNVGAYSLPTSTDWTRYKCTGIIPSGSTIVRACITIKRNGTVYATNFKLEKGNKATEWSPAPEDINTDITTKTNNALNSAKSYADTKKTEAINSANSTLNTTIANYYTKAQTDSQIKIAKDAIDLSVKNTYETKTEVTNKINAIQVGGRNLQKNTEFKTNLANWTVGTGFTRETSKKFENTNTVKFSRTGLTSDTVSYFYSGQNVIPIEVGQTVTASANFYTDGISGIDGGKAFIGIWFYNSSGSSIDNSKTTIPFVNGKWIKCSHTATAPANTVYSAIVIGTYRNGTYYVGKPMFEKGNKATDWSPAPEDVTSDITQAKNDAITSANGTLTSTIANYYTKTQTDSQIKVAKDAITSSVSSTYETKTNVQNKIDAIKVGGRNLWLRTKEYKANTDTIWVDNNNGYRVTNAPYTTVNGFGVQRIASAWTDISQRVAIESNTEYTLSAFIKWESQVGVLIFYDSVSPQSNKNITSQVGTSSYKRVSVTFNSNTGTVSTCRFECTTNTPYLIYGLKLEKGNKATDWSPAPEDVDNTISSLSTRVSTAEQKITSDAIVSTVTSSATYKNNLTGKVDKTTIISSINQTAESVKINASKIELTGSVVVNAINGGSTLINGSKIQTGTITADKIAVGDFTNYAQLNDNTASIYGFTKGADEANGAWLTRNSMGRDIAISDFYTCNGGETFRVKADISTTIKGNTASGGTDSTYRGTAIGIFVYDGTGKTITWLYSTRVSNATQSVSSTITLPTTARKFRVYIQTESYGNWSGTLKVRNIQVTRMTSGELIVNGAITANMITSGTFQGTNFIAGGSSNGNGYFQVKDTSNTVKFHASKDGVYATKIQFPDSISISGSIIQSGNVSASSSGFATSGSESGSLYRTEYQSNLGLLGLTISSQYYNTEGGGNVAGTKKTIKISGDAIGFTAGSSYAQLSQSGTNIYSQGGYDSYNGYYCDGTMSLKKASHGGIDVGNTSAGVVICSKTSPTWWNGSKSYTVYTSGSKPTPADIGAAKALVSANGYQGMTLNDGSTSNWIRTTTNGLLPSASSGSSWPSSSSSLGTSSWRFSKGYVKEMYVNGLTNDLGDIWLTAKTGANTIYAQAKWLCPATSVTTYLGSSGYRWHSVWAANGTIQTSDERFKVKQGFTNIDDCFEMIKNTDIYNYIMLNKSKEKLSKNRLGKMAMENSKNDVNIHIGIMAQDIQKYECSKGILIESEYEKEDGTTDTLLGINAYGLATAVMGGLKKEIQIRNEQYECLKRENEELKTRLANIERMLTRTLD